MSGFFEPDVADVILAELIVIAYEVESAIGADAFDGAEGEAVLGLEADALAFVEEEAVVGGGDQRESLPKEEVILLEEKVEILAEEAVA